MRDLFEMIFDPLNAVMAAIPIAFARWCAVGLLVSAVIAVAFLKREYIFIGLEDPKWYHDLRLWTLVIMIPYIIIYLVL